MFLGGWGAVVAVLAGIGVGGYVATVVGTAWGFLDALMVRSGVSVSVRLWSTLLVLLCAWAVIVAIAVSNTGSRTLTALRHGVGDAAALLRAASLVALVSVASGLFWVRPTTPEHDAFLGEFVGGLPALFLGTDRWWMLLVVLGLTFAFVWLYRSLTSKDLPS